MKLNNKSKVKLIVIGGPTATGKTDYAIKLAKKLNGELINADSRQIYKTLDIATNKGTITPLDQTFDSKLGYILQAYDIENSGIKGWLFNIINPDQEFNLAIYKNLADEIIADILDRGKQPILVGGTGLYIDAIINNYQLNASAENTQSREQLNQLSLEALTDRLNQLDPLIINSLNNSDKNNPRRLIRLIEKSNQTTKSEYTKGESNYKIEFYYPIFEKEALFNKINTRVVAMMQQGLLEETQTAIDQGYKDSKPLQSFGYHEALAYLNKEISYDKCLELIQLEHRQYAKRQITWFEGKGRGYNLIHTQF
jgi:tRNA dimethylallyltransferase